MTATRLNPDGLHDPTDFGYSHTVAVPSAAGLVLVAGQYGSGPDGQLVSEAFGDQVRRALENVGVALAAHGLTSSDVVQLRSYVVDHDLEKLGAVVGEVRRIWGQDLPVHTVLGVAALAVPELAYEVEAVAVRR